jgi:predicted enzyme related to lactoylglutathione lyase
MRESFGVTTVGSPLPLCRVGEPPEEGESMLDQATVTANIPAADLARARAFYADKLGLSPSQEIEGIVLLYRTAAGSTFSVYQTEYAGQSGHTIAQWHVDDVNAEVLDLKSKGVAFEHYDMPGVEWNHDVATMGGMGKAAWFRDSENNILCIDDGFPGEPVS